MSQHRIPAARDEGGMWLHWLVRLRWVAPGKPGHRDRAAINVLDNRSVTVPIMVVAMVCWPS